MNGGERAARERLETLFLGIDRLTPDELARIGYTLPPRDQRDPLLDAVGEAARRAGRVELVEEARAAARGAVMARYSAGSLHPTFAGLNWGLSQGTVESRIAIAEAMADAAAAAVLEDVLDPDIATALALDAASITDLAAGEASEGSLARAIRNPEDPELGPRPWARIARHLFAILMVALSVVWVAIGVVMVWAGGLVGAARRRVARGG